MRRITVLLLCVLLSACVRAGDGTVLQVPKDIVETPLLFGSRITDVNRPHGKVFAAGQRNPHPRLVQFVLRDSCLVLEPEGPQRRKGRGFQPVAFRILEETADSYRIDLLPYFSTYPEEISAVPPKMLDGTATEFSILGTHSGSDHLQVCGRYCYADGLELTACCYLLPLKRTPIEPRRPDPRKVGYTRIEGHRSENLPALRWDLSGGRKLRFYVDRTFPGEWFPYIKEGIEDWNKAFEAIGMGDVLEVLPEPADGSLDCGSPLVNMVRYLDVEESNAKGDVLYDPRSGEILQADILWWKNVLELICNWRYVQTGAADPAARAEEYPIEILGPMIRHAVCHEMGHALGLSHNMGASWAYPTDSLRSVSFTQKYGTAASVMDYARYNHLATATDVAAGVGLLPPRLGPYDYYAIALGYGSGEPEAGEYCYFAPFISAAISPDPSAQAETLGNDLLRSSAAGLDNCRALLELDGLTSERIILLRNQYYHYIWLSLSNIGGAVAGVPVTQELCDETVAFVLSALASVPEALYDKGKEKRILGELDGNFLPERVEKTMGAKGLKHYRKQLTNNNFYAENNH